MMKILRYSAGVTWLLVAALASSCQTSEGEGAEKPSGVGLTFTDEITDSTRALHVNHNAVSFPEGTTIQLKIDYAKIEEGQEEEEEEEVLLEQRREYVKNVIFTKRPGSNIFDSPYSIVWLDEFLFDIYAFYPSDLYRVQVTYPDEPLLQYNVINVDYNTKTPQYYQDATAWYATTGATLYCDNGTTPTSDPHDLITSQVLHRSDVPHTKYITFGTKYIDHGEEPVGLRFMHRLSRFEPYFVNGMGDSGEEVYLQGIAIYPTISSAAFAVRRHRWVRQQTQDLFRFSDDKGGWQHYDTANSEWEENVVDNNKWPDYFDEAPLKYEFTTPYKLRSSTAVMAQDEVSVDGETVHPNVEFRMLPDSGIDCMLLHFKIRTPGQTELADAYVPVRFKTEMNQGKEVKTQMGHTTRVILSYKATMITLLHVHYIDDWNSLPGYYAMGDVEIE